jgi:hypothetical protein
LISEDKLNPRLFSWQNLLLFVLGNIFLILPAVAFYLFVCGALAADHFSDGFLSLRPSGLIVQVRKYVRPDGKTIQLVPMAHVGDARFYRNISRSFPTDATILMEGVSDERNLLTNKISYHKMAKSLGLSEQQNEFRPRGQIVRADIDVEEFAPGTIALLNLVMFVHSRGLNSETLMKLLEYSPPPNFQQQLFDDILRKRNRRLLDEIHDQLPDSEIIIVPWGVAHLPEIAAEIQHQGFQLKEKTNYAVIRFGSSRK